MNSQVTLKDVAKAVGLSETTVSLVVNGKAAQRGITPATQARVSAAIRQMGYQPDLINRAKALHQVAPRAAVHPDGISNGKPQIANEIQKSTGRQIGLVLSASSQTSTLALIPGLDQDLTAAGYQLNIIVISADPTSTRARISQLLNEDPAGILACPNIYAATTATVAGICPVIVLWQDAAKAMLAKLGVRSTERGVVEDTTALSAGAAPDHATPIPNPPTATPPSNQNLQDGSAGTPRPTQMQEIPQGRAKPPAEPVIFQQAAKPVIQASTPPPLIIETPPQAPTIIPGPTPIETPQEPTVTTPEPVINA
jgi:hypothetical protein